MSRYYSRGDSSAAEKGTRGACSRKRVAVERVSRRVAISRCTTDDPASSGNRVHASLSRYLCTRARCPSRLSVFERNSRANVNVEFRRSTNSLANPPSALASFSLSKKRKKECNLQNPSFRIRCAASPARCFIVFHSGPKPARKATAFCTTMFAAISELSVPPISRSVSPDLRMRDFL